MAVLARMREESKYEFYNTAIKLRKCIIFLLLRDFGIKDKVRNKNFYTSKMNEEDKQVFENILVKYEIVKIPEEYPEWIINKLRESIWDLTNKLVQHITAAYTIWATIPAEADEKRLEQDRAIACCESLLQAFTVVIDVLPVDANKYIKYVDMIEKEIALIKAWRKSCNKFKKQFEKK